MQKTILVFGAIAGLIVSATLTIMMLIHRQNPVSFGAGQLIGYSSMLLSASLIPVAIKSYRDRYQSGVISFKDAFLMGLGIALISSAMYVATWVFIYKNIYPNFVADFTKSMFDKLTAEGKSAAEIDESIQEMKQMFSYYDTWLGLIGLTFMEILPIGLIVALISALVLKKKGTGVEPVPMG